MAQVKQQLQIWENELNCLQVYEGVCLEFTDPSELAAFNIFQNKNQMALFVKAEEWKADKRNVVVVDRKFEAMAYNFINNVQQ